MERHSIYPGFHKGFSLVEQDEHRHIAFGVRFLRDVVDGAAGDARGDPADPDQPAAGGGPGLLPARGRGRDRVRTPTTTPRAGLRLRLHGPEAAHGRDRRRDPAPGGADAGPDRPPPASRTSSPSRSTSCPSAPPRRGRRPGRASAGPGALPPHLRGELHAHASRRRSPWLGERPQSQPIRRTRRHSSRGVGGKSCSVRVAAVAARQAIGRDTCHASSRECGLSGRPPSSRWVRLGRLHWIYPGVYAVGHGSSPQRVADRRAFLRRTGRSIESRHRRGVVGHPPTQPISVSDPRDRLRRALPAAGSRRSPRR